MAMLNNQRVYLKMNNCLSSIRNLDLTILLGFPEGQNRNVKYGSPSHNVKQKNVTTKTFDKHWMTYKTISIGPSKYIEFQ